MTACEIDSFICLENFLDVINKFCYLNDMLSNWSSCPGGKVIRLRSEVPKIQGDIITFIVWKVFLQWRAEYWKMWDFIGEDLVSIWSEHAPLHLNS